MQGAAEPVTPGAGGWGLSLSWDSCSVNQSFSVLSCAEITSMAEPCYMFQRKGFLNTKSVCCVVLFVFSLRWKAGGVSLSFRGVSTRCQQCTSVGLVRWGQKDRCLHRAQPWWQLPQCVGGLAFASLAHPLAITEENHGYIHFLPGM